jgi:hypothetical protein
LTVDAPSVDTLPHAQHYVPTLFAMMMSRAVVASVAGLRAHLLRGAYEGTKTSSIEHCLGSVAARGDSADPCATALHWWGFD